MDFIQPLALETWFINVMSGGATYFAPIAIFAIISLSAYFRMVGMTMGLMIFIFLLMFGGYIPASLLVFISIIAGLVIGLFVSRIVK